ncbi:MAG: hypothetical protein WD827_01610 [Solirubrobacterales bacterium]
MEASIDLQAGTVLVLVTLIVLPIAAVAFARSGTAWKELGKGPFAIDQAPPPSPAQPDQPVDRAVQEAEARQMLEAKSFRRQQRGEAPIDVEAAMSRLLDSPAEAPTADAELRAEVRRLVVASNERRLRRGEAQLDVEAEIERQLSEFA